MERRDRAQWRDLPGGESDHQIRYWVSSGPAAQTYELTSSPDGGEVLGVEVRHRLDDGRWCRTYAAPDTMNVRSWGIEPTGHVIHSLDPLHLEPAIDCNLCASRGHIRDGHWVEEPARILGLVCTRNEADRYLAEVMAHHWKLCDRILVYDDRSEDFTALIATPFADVVVRAPDAPSFEQDESAFRQDAWRAMETALAPTPADWVLCFDADEFLISAAGQSLAELVASAGTADVVEFPVDEIFDAAVPSRRVDGFWGSITAKRLARYRPGLTYRPQPLAGGSLPVYPGPTHRTGREWTIRHFGYARPEDRFAKYQRYRDRVGHNSGHVGSILWAPTLEPC